VNHLFVPTLKREHFRRHADASQPCDDDDYGDVSDDDDYGDVDDDGDGRKDDNLVVILTSNPADASKTC
jgi:hypothetical protein